MPRRKYIPLSDSFLDNRKCVSIQIPRDLWQHQIVKYCNYIEFLAIRYTCKIWSREFKYVSSLDELIRQRIKLVLDYSSSQNLYYDNDLTDYSIDDYSIADRIINLVKSGHYVFGPRILLGTIYDLPIHIDYMSTHNISDIDLIHKSRISKKAYIGNKGKESTYSEANYLWHNINGIEIDYEDYSLESRVPFLEMFHDGKRMQTKNTSCLFSKSFVIDTTYEPFQPSRSLIRQLCYLNFYGFKVESNSGTRINIGQLQQDIYEDKKSTHYYDMQHVYQEYGIYNSHYNNDNDDYNDDDEYFYDVEEEFWKSYRKYSKSIGKFKCFRIS